MTNITVRTQPEETHKYLLIFVLELFDNYDTISEIVIDYSMRVGLGPLSIVVGDNILQKGGRIYEESGY